jgi:hypothetical protein
MKNAEYTKKQIDLLVKKFLERTLPTSEWTHEAHLIVGIWHCANYDFFEAVCRIKSGIILLNQHHGTKNKGNSGYHETLTIFWSKIITAYISMNIEAAIDQLVNSFLNSPLADRSLPFEFYEKEKLMSKEMRAVYHESCLQTIDELTIKKYAAIKDVERI